MWHIRWRLQCICHHTVHVQQHLCAEALGPLQGALTLHAGRRGCPATQWIVCWTQVDLLAVALSAIK